MGRALMLGAVIAGCAGPAATAGEGTPRAARYVISREQIEASGSTNAFDVIESVRPQWLGGHRGGATLPVVYLDGIRFGELESLRTIGTTDVAEIRYIDPREASRRFGAGHSGGAIEVIRMR